MFRKIALDHISGRHRIPVTLKQLKNWNAFGVLLEVMGSSAATFAVWAELRAWRKLELINNFPLFQSCQTVSNSSLTSGGASVDQPVKFAPDARSESSMFLIGRYLLCGSEYQVDFPLSLDHQLFILVQHNALQGMLTNMAILMRLSGQDFQGWDNFYTEGLSIPSEKSPPSLRFTHKQRTVPHETWIDVIPWACMRDNVIRHQDQFDTDELCADFLGGFEEGINDSEGRGILLWGDPWCETAWELSETFVRKWWFLLRGCNDLITSTNKWRQARGEKRLAISL